MVYSVIAEPDTLDAQGDVMSAETIEELAHNFLLPSRKFDNRHDWRAVDPAPVESWIKREATLLLREKIKAIVGWRAEGICRPYLAEGSDEGVSVLQHRRVGAKVPKSDLGEDENLKDPIVL